MEVMEAKPLVVEGIEGALQGRDIRFYSEYIWLETREHAQGQWSFKGGLQGRDGSA